MHNKRVNPCIHITHNKRAHTHNMQLHEQEMARAGSLAPALHALVPPYWKMLAYRFSASVEHALAPPVVAVAFLLNSFCRSIGAMLEGCVARAVRLELTRCALRLPETRRLLHNTQQVARTNVCLYDVFKTLFLIFFYRVT